MKCIVTSTVRFEHKKHGPGSVIDLPEASYNKLYKAGIIIPISAKETLEESPLGGDLGIKIISKTKKES